MASEIRLACKFDKSEESFPVKNDYIFLSHCGVSPLYSGGLKRLVEVGQRQMLAGSASFGDYSTILNSLRTSAAELLKVSADDVAFVKNTTEGISLIANGFPFEPGDEVISYVHEYPANHYPWRLQAMSRDVKLVLLPDRATTGAAPPGRPSGWDMHDLEQSVTERTRLVVLSHVQFTSGFAADLESLDRFCRDRGLDLVLDVAQSMGAMPVYPEQHGVSAVVSPGWKWLMGPFGAGLLYTSEPFRKKLNLTVVGAETMRQGMDYLDHRWDPHDTAKRFEYSSSPHGLAAALDACIREIPLRYGVECIYQEILRLQSVFLGLIDRSRYTPLIHVDANQSVILSMVCQQDPKKIENALLHKGVVCTSRGGYLRFAPHVYTTDDEVHQAATILNSIEVN